LSGSFTGRAGELRVYQENGHTLLAGDVNGDGRADFTISVDWAQGVGTLML
jgi:hypothetical protein